MSPVCVKRARFMAVALPLVALLAVGCAAEMQAPDEVASSSEPLFGDFQTQNCTAAETAMLHDAWSIGKVVALGTDFERCVLNAPYVPCDDDIDPRATTAVAVSRSPNDTSVSCADLPKGIGGQ